jgi:PPOX class probable F420-dependent enzyme
MPDAVIPVSHRDLLEKSPIVTLATSGPDGFPQVSAMWFFVEADGTIAASLNTSRQKTKNLRRHPEVALLFIDPGTPYRTLELRCRASVEPDPDYAFADRVSAKYGAGSLREQDRPGESRVVVRFAPVKANTFG